MFYSSCNNMEYIYKLWEGPAISHRSPSPHPPCGCAFEWGDPSEEIAYDNNSFNVRPLPPHFSGLSLSSSAFNQRSLYSTSMSSRSLSSSSVSPVPSKELRSLISWAFIQLEIYWTQWITFSFAHLSCLRDFYWHWWPPHLYSHVLLFWWLVEWRDCVLMYLCIHTGVSIDIVSNNK